MPVKRRAHVRFLILMDLRESSAIRSRRSRLTRLSRDGCGSFLESDGLTAHLRRVRSIPRATSEGMAVGDQDLVRLVDELLPPWSSRKSRAPERAGRALYGTGRDDPRGASEARLSRSGTPFSNSGGIDPATATGRSPTGLHAAPGILWGIRDTRDEREP